MKKFVRMAALILAAVLLTAGAGAEFSPAVGTLMNNPVRLTVGAEIGTLTAVSDVAYATLEKLLPRVSFRVTAQEAPRPADKAEILLDGEVVWSCLTALGSNYRLNMFYPTGMSYLTAADGLNAAEMLLGTEQGFEFEPQKLLGAYLGECEGLYAALEEINPGKKTKESTSIKNTSGSASYITYTLKKDLMNENADAIVPFIRNIVRAVCGDRFEDTLAGMTFTGDCKFKRFLDKAGGDMGLQFTGNIDFDGDNRKVTLFAGATAGKGGYFSLALPAVKGNINTKVTFGAKLTEKNGKNTLALTATYTDNADEKITVEAEGTLNNALSDGGEAITGKITANVTLGKNKYVYTVQPALSGTGEEMTGTVGVTCKEGSKVTLNCTVRLSAEHIENVPGDPGASALDLRKLSKTEALRQLEREKTSLLVVFMNVLNELEDKDRALLTYELGKYAWTDGESVPVLPDPDDDYEDDYEDDCWDDFEDEEEYDPYELIDDEEW